MTTRQIKQLFGRQKYICFKVYMFYNTFAITIGAYPHVIISSESWFVIIVFNT